MAATLPAGISVSVMRSMVNTAVWNDTNVTKNQVSSILTRRCSGLVNCILLAPDPNSKTGSSDVPVTDVVMRATLVSVLTCNVADSPGAV